MNNDQKVFLKVLSRILPFARGLSYVVLVLFVGVAAMIYFTEGRNLVQVFAISGFGIVLFFLLRGLICFSEKLILKGLR